MNRPPQAAPRISTLGRSRGAALDFVKGASRTSSGVRAKSHLVYRNVERGARGARGVWVREWMRGKTDGLALVLGPVVRRLLWRLELLVRLCAVAKQVGLQHRVVAARGGASARSRATEVELRAMKPHARVAQSATELTRNWGANTYLDARGNESARRYGRHGDEKQEAGANGGRGKRREGQTEEGQTEGLGGDGGVGDGGGADGWEMEGRGEEGK
eukprot:6203481-Pleurochrysis_carterae.AAC.1